MSTLNAPVDLYYFTGTGNTLLAAREVQKTLIGRGRQCALHRIETSDPAAVDPTHVLGLGFPIAGFTTYPLVWTFIEKLPRSQGAPAFAFATMGGMAFAAMGPLGRILDSKGYHLLGATQISMPTNLWSKRYDPDKTSKRTEQGLAHARRFANDLADRKARWRTFPLLGRLLHPLLTSKKMWSSAPDYVRIDRDKCTKCALCVELCPADAIELNQEVVLNGKCQWCLRCVSYCPEKALYYSKDRYERYKPVRIEEILHD
ncbi:MAG: EFR1 family ferrodoxin [Candidatus Edwardsbacteria bacterium]|jgi:ferredoxin/flavodoxin|nr:EFR1 family ferrodoxin [Candidatus Edwardsbacteria bacterium]